MAEPALARAARVPEGYAPSDAERRLPEQHSNRSRSDFARDRARILHSSALRRLAVKTQVLSPTSGLDFARNRLTHSLEVAQVGRELAGRLALDPDVVDTACLAHDLGHPPFGHNGERALNEWAEPIGGFEGNAQTLRVLTRLEPKVYGPPAGAAALDPDADPAPFGLNLTRASLDASCKYPWPRTGSVTDPGSGRRKFGFYPDDEPVFAWLREGAPEGRLCIEAQVMDLSDDIAYSVHDLEDAIVSGYIDVRSLGDRVDHDGLIDAVRSWSGDEFDRDQLAEAFDRLDGTDHWMADWDGSRRDHARLKNLTSQLIGRFAGAAVRATREAHEAGSLARYGGSVVVPEATRAEIAVLKGIVAAHVMSTNARQPIYAQQREILTELADALLARPEELDPGFGEDWRLAPDDAARARVVVDQVASLTDPSATAWHERLC
ncbi:MAG: deoxyguanosinetriphosphate triphosphohydrolase [Actinomycetales bacterium]|nr:deoxyguanosinetriphosphate triphosphohydrolase [Actinomycetales bacterium]